MRNQTRHFFLINPPIIMKKINILIYFLWFSIINLSAQFTDVVISGLNQPGAMALKGNDLYISNEMTGNIVKINITDALPATPSSVISGLNSPGGLVFVGDDLYFAEFSAGQISKVDITAPILVPDPVVTGLSGPNRLLLNGNDLYFSESFSGEISMIDITDSSPIPVTVASGLDFPIDLALSGNDLFVSVTNDQKISKIDISQTFPTTASDFVTGFSSPAGLLVNGNDLYISRALSDNIAKVDITQTNPTPTNFISGIDGPFGLLLNGDDLYIVERNENKIIKYTFVSFAPSLSFCIDDPVQTGLSGGTPNGGTYSGSGVTDDSNGETFSFDPLAAGSGTHTLTYSDGISSATVDYDVFELPPVTLDLADTVFIIDGVLPTGIGGGSPSGGMYSDTYGEIDDDGNGMTFSFNNTVTPNMFNEIIYTYTDPQTGCTNFASQLIFVETITDVEDLEKVELDIFPNPTSGIIHLQGLTTERVELIDLQGRIIQIESNPINELNISDFPSGIYFLKIYVEGQVLTRRILKK